MFNKLILSSLLMIACFKAIPSAEARSSVSFGVHQQCFAPQPIIHEQYIIQQPAPIYVQQPVPVYVAPQPIYYTPYYPTTYVQREVIIQRPVRPLMHSGFSVGFHFGR